MGLWKISQPSKPYNAQWVLSLIYLFQDTVVALHALSKYGAATFTKTGKAAQVTIQSSGTFSSKFQVDNNNRLLLQQVSLPELPGEYSMKVTGEGCVYLQVRLLGRWGQRTDEDSSCSHWEVLTQKTTGQIRERVREVERNSGKGQKTDFVFDVL